jgi:predicted phosphodiesterase
MKTTRSITAAFAVLSFILLSCIHGSANAQTETNRIESLAQRADAIVVGKVTSVRSEWNADKTRIITKVSLDVDEYVKGEAAGKSMVITNLGGEVDGVGEWYSHAPKFTKDENVLLFVKKDSKNNFILSGGTDAKLSVTKDDKTGERMVPGGVTLKVFTSKVKSLLVQQGIK